MSGNVTEPVSVHIISAAEYEQAGDWASAAAEMQSAIEELPAGSGLLATYTARWDADIAQSRVFNAQRT